MTMIEDVIEVLSEGGQMTAFDIEHKLHIGLKRTREVLRYGIRLENIRTFKVSRESLGIQDGKKRVAVYCINTEGPSEKRGPLLKDERQILLYKAFAIARGALE